MQGKLQHYPAKPGNVERPSVERVPMLGSTLQRDRSLANRNDMTAESLLPDARKLKQTYDTGKIFNFQQNLPY